MSQANVELVQRGFEHFVVTGEPAWETLHEQVEVYDHDIMDGREYRGRADVRLWLYEDWAAAWSDYSAEPQEFIEADDDRVIAVLGIKATGRAHMEGRLSRVGPPSRTRRARVRRRSRPSRCACRAVSEDASSARVAVAGSARRSARHAGPARPGVPEGEGPPLAGGGSGGRPRPAGAGRA